MLCQATRFRLRAASALAACKRWWSKPQFSKGCERLYSEDLNAGQHLDSVVVVNPFKTTLAKDR